MISDATTPAVTLGQILTVEIQDLAFGGEGVARVNEFVLFVPFVIPGETVEVEVTEVKKSFGRAKLNRVITPAPSRTEPLCARILARAAAANTSTSPTPASCSSNTNKWPTSFNASATSILISSRPLFPARNPTATVIAS
jgi:predicted RNA-binding protein with TRAM domain